MKLYFLRVAHGCLNDNYYKINIVSQMFSQTKNSFFEDFGIHWKVKLKFGEKIMSFYVQNTLIGLYIIFH